MNYYYYYIFNNKLIATAYKVFGLFLLLSFSIINAKADTIEVGGIIESNQYWTNDNTYLVTQDLIITNNLNLTIEAGVEVRINYNRGIIVDGGSLIVLGMEGDSVSFSSNYSNPDQEHWKWKGIVIENINGGSSIVYSSIKNAETAITIDQCLNFIVENSSLSECQNYGIKMLNSSYCVVNNCEVIRNINGLEISASALQTSSNNNISNSVFNNTNQNIYIHAEIDGITNHNIISENLIINGNNGIWIINKGNNNNHGNQIKGNFIINNGLEVGYGLFLAHDSTVVHDNIFWKNNIAIYSEESASNCEIVNNNFYQNNRAILNGTNSLGNKYLNNTFSLNESRLFTIRETEGVEFINNNMLHNNDDNIIVVNNTTSDLNIANNYWGTTDTALISYLIFDKIDNPGLGELEYNPILESLDTTNPVSAPFKVYKQIDGDKLKLSWRVNPEEDIKGYRIYFGDFIDYSFTNKITTGLDTSFVLSGINSVYDSVAVTAFDSFDENNNLQKTGHESPFVFAVFYPFAGNDTTICRNIPNYDIQDANIPMEYSSLEWTSEGDGYFSNPEETNPSYYPGSQDYINGDVKISLKVITTNNVYTDSFVLSIKNDPIAYAGNDTIIFPDISLSLINADAHFYDSINWVSSGDGEFNSNTLINPVYTPGINDIEAGEVFLEMTAYSSCEPSVDTVKVIIEPYFSVEGQLWSEDKYLNPSAVIAYKENQGGIRATNITNAFSNGTFKFEKLITGNYCFYAVPDTNNIEKVIPAYYANKSTWQNANFVNVNADVFDIDIKFPKIEYLLPAGNASISGKMLIPSESKYNSNIYCTSWMDNSSNEFCMEGLSNVTILLYNHNKSKLLDFTLTDNLGNFYFNNLPYGNYIVDAEKAGFLSIASPMIKLNPEHNVESGIILEISQEKLSFTLQNSPQPEYGIKVFPNPASSQINITYLDPRFTSAKLELYDIFGKCILKQNLSPNDISSTFNISIYKFPSGIYFGIVKNSEEVYKFRFIKR